MDGPIRKGCYRLPGAGSRRTDRAGAKRDVMELVKFRERLPDETLPATKKRPACKPRPALPGSAAGGHRLKRGLPCRGFAERDRDSPFGVELRRPHQIHVVESTGLVRAAGQNVIQAVAGKPVLGDCPDGFV